MNNEKLNQSVRPCSEEINCDTSSTLHWAGPEGRQLGAELSVGGWGAAWWQEAEEAGERDMGSSSSSSPLDSSSEWLDSERHCGGDTRQRSQGSTFQSSGRPALPPEPQLPSIRCHE